MLLQSINHIYYIVAFSVCAQIRDELASKGMEPLEEEIPHEDIIGREYCRYKIKNLMAP